MLEHVNNLKGLATDSNYPNLAQAATQGLELWKKFTDGVHTRAELVTAIDELLASEVMQNLEYVDDKMVGYVAQQLEGLKTQDPANHLPSTVFDVHGNDISYEPLVTFTRSDPLE